MSTVSTVPRTRAPVWVVEDDEAFRQAVEAVLERAPRALCAASFADAESALAALDEGAPPPKVILMDVNLPGLDGITCTACLKAREPEVHVVMLTIREDAGTMVAALQAGASGHLAKNASAETILDAVDEVQRGGLCVPSPLRNRVLQLLHARPLPSPVPLPCAEGRHPWLGPPEPARSPTGGRGLPPEGTTGPLRRLWTFPNPRPQAVAERVRKWWRKGEGG